MNKINIRKTYYHIRHRYVTTNNLVIAVALFIAVSWAWGSVSVMERNYKLQSEIDAKQRQLTLLQLENDTLKFQQTYYKSDEYKELAVRQRLGLAAPGEKVLILPPNSAAAKASDQATENQEAPKATKQPGNFAQWLTFLFGGNREGLQQ